MAHLQADESRKDVLSRHSNVHGRWVGVLVPVRNDEGAGDSGVQSW